MKNIAIIGAGISGLVLSYNLREKGYNVAIFERKACVGGQLYAIEIEKQKTEIFYHHTFISDKNFLELCNKLNLNESLHWLTSRMAYYADHELYSFSNPFDLITFKPLSIVNKFKFIISIIRLQYFTKIDEIKNISAKEWFKKYGYEKVWNVIWAPLFRLKFAELADEISIIWLADKLVKRGKSRGKSSKEKLCYMEGSFYKLVETLKEKITEMGVEIITNSNVKEINVENDGKYSIIINDNGKFNNYDIIVSTLSSNAHMKIFKFEQQYIDYLKNYKYQSVVCAILVLKRKYSEYYWINIGDFTLPFGGIIEHTNFVGNQKYNGKSVLYISKYLNKDSSFYGYTDEMILDEFCKGLKKINSEFESNEILEYYIFRENDAQPIVGINYNKPDYNTSEAGIFWISTHHVYPHDRGIEYAIEQANNLSGMF